MSLMSLVSQFEQAHAEAASAIDIGLWLVLGISVGQPPRAFARVEEVSLDKEAAPDDDLARLGITVPGRPHWRRARSRVGRSPRVGRSRRRQVCGVMNLPRY